MPDNDGRGTFIFLRKRKMRNVQQMPVDLFTTTGGRSMSKYISDKLTEKQAAIYKFVKAYCRKHGGLSPTYQEMSDGLKISKSRIQSHMRMIDRKGFVKLTGMERGIKILK